MLSIGLIRISDCLLGKMVLKNKNFRYFWFLNHNNHNNNHMRLLLSEFYKLFSSYFLDSTFSFLPSDVASVEFWMNRSGLNSSGLGNTTGSFISRNRENISLASWKSWIMIKGRDPIQTVQSRIIEERIRRTSRYNMISGSSPL